MQGPSMQEMNEQLYDIYTQWHVPFWQTPLFWFMCGLCFVVVVSALIGRFIICWLRKKNILPYPIVARNDLKKLQESEYASLQHAAFFYVTLITILKKYLTAYYSHDFTSKTDQECLDALASMAHNKQLYDIVEHILNGSLTVRFAQAHVVEQVIQDDLDNVFQVITITQFQNKSE